jgi:hypothetical protein
VISARSDSPREAMFVPTRSLTNMLSPSLVYSMTVGNSSLSWVTSSRTKTSSTPLR